MARPPTVSRVPFIESTSRVGRSQGASIFWGLVSVFFAAAACFYFWKSHENESAANKYRGEVVTLQDDNDKLTTEKAKLQASMSDAAGQLKTREEFLDEKEAKLAAQESRLESLAQKAPSAASTATPKKFSDVVHRVSQDDGVDVVTRAGRPVLRIPNTTFFAPGDAALKPEGITLLTQIAQSLSSQSDGFELRIENFTDSEPEAAEAPAKNDKGDKKEKDKPAKPPDEATSKTHYATSWDLTAARAATIAHFFRTQDSFPFQNVLVTARGDSQPIVSGGKNHARNARTEIGVTPLPAPARSSDSSKLSGNPDASASSLAPPPDPPAPAKDKDKDKAK